MASSRWPTSDLQELRGAVAGARVISKANLVPQALFVIEQGQLSAVARSFAPMNWGAGEGRELTLVEDRVTGARALLDFARGR